MTGKRLDRESVKWIRPQFSPCHDARLLRKFLERQKKNFTREISTSFTLKVWSILFPSSHAVTSLTSLPSWNDKDSLKRSFVEMCEFWAIFIRSCLPWSRVVKDRTHLHLGWKTAEKHQIWGSRLICSKNPSVSFLFKLLVRQVKSSYSCFWNVSP